MIISVASASVVVTVATAAMAVASTTHFLGHLLANLDGEKRHYQGVLTWSAIAFGRESLSMVRVLLMRFTAEEAISHNAVCCH